MLVFMGSGNVQWNNHMSEMLFSVKCSTMMLLNTNILPLLQTASGIFGNIGSIVGAGGGIWLNWHRGQR